MIGMARGGVPVRKPAAARLSFSDWRTRRPRYAPLRAWASRFIMRDLRRAALLGWIAPLDAALSSATTAILTERSAAEKSPSDMSLRAFLTYVLARLLNGWLRRRFLEDDLSDLAAGNCFTPIADMRA